MSVMSVQSPSFKAYIPVTYYAKNPVNNKYVRVKKPENIKKCHSFVVRNLNGSAKSNKNKEFVDLYSLYDSDYREQKSVRSVYEFDNAGVLMITGSDVNAVEQMAKPIGVAKSDAIERTGKPHSFEIRLAGQDYFSNLKSFLKHSCSQVKNKDGKNLSMRVYFNPKYKKDGTIKGFDFVNMRMITEDNN